MPDLRAMPFHAMLTDSSCQSRCQVFPRNSFSQILLLQVAWQNGLTDLAMPFMIQFMKDYVGKVDTLMADRKENIEARKVCTKPLASIGITKRAPCMSFAAA